MKRKLKEIFKYLIRIFIFILLSRYDYIFDFYTTPLLHILAFILGSGGEFLAIVIVMYLNVYVIAKFCGLFKKLDNLNFFISLAVVCFIDVLFNISDWLIVQIFPLKFSFYKSAYLCLVLACFILYKILYFLSKKFPNPFQKIGYYTSIEFYKNILNKFKQ